jgi:phosphohistidine phosphatase
MKNLILVRHAKSSWESPLHDKERALATRGVNDAHLVSLDILKYLPKTFVIWSSTARRAADTAIIFAQNMLYPVESIIFEDELYTFDDKQLEQMLRKCNNVYENVILFGHNEAITNFVNSFGDINIENVPTAGFVSLQFETNDWKTINKGKTQQVVFPRDLKV